MRIRRSVLVLAAMLLATSLGAQTLRVGLALGFPPYQYSIAGRPAGLDVDLTEAILHEAGYTVTWVQGPWDDVLATLRTTRDLDLVAGMEKTGIRRTLFLLGRTLYARKNLLFLRANEPAIHRLEDLVGRAVAGDRDSGIEELLASRGLKDDVRLVRTQTKEEAFAQLSTGKVAAAIMPEAVGWTLARKADIVVKVLDFGNPGSPVGLAFPRDRPELLKQLDEAVLRLEARGTIRTILSRFTSNTLR